MKKITIQVDVKPQSYDIFIGNGLFFLIADEITKMKKEYRCAVITDSRVRPLHGARLLEALKEKGIEAELFDFPEGEAHKTREVKNSMEDALLEKHYGRDSLIIALGGGVVGDMAGYVAATFMRGIPFVQVPTTIVAQADSSIGGKTGVDTPHGKNLIGAFHHPLTVFIDIKTLETLDDRNYFAGMAEIIKHGIIRDRNLFDFLDKNSGVITARTGKDYEELMTGLLNNNCKIKNDVVARDTKESNLRKILNYGHTIGHAVEHLSGYGLLHGEAVAVGMAVEGCFSWQLGYMKETEFRHQLEVLKKYRLPVEIPGEISVDGIMEIMGMDKKARKGVPEFVLIEKTGQYKVFEGGKTVTPVDEATLRRLIEEIKDGKYY